MTPIRSTTTPVALGDLTTRLLVDRFAANLVGADNADQNQCFRRAAALVVQGTILRLQATLPCGILARRDLIAALHLPPRELAAFAAQGDPAVRNVIPSAFAAGALSYSDKLVLNLVAAVASKLAA
ncbi:MAG TPA: hypothetical protein VF292_08355 [Rhodanobacteraceae bacterium]